ncbi:hypothetical protein ACVFI8_13725 [Agarivorans sp. MS3-6]
MAIRVFEQHHNHYLLATEQGWQQLPVSTANNRRILVMIARPKEAMGQNLISLSTGVHLWPQCVSCFANEIELAD